MAGVQAALDAALQQAANRINGLVVDGVSNGTIGPNFMMPLAGRISPHMYVLHAPGDVNTLATASQQIMVMSGANFQDMPADRCSIAAAVAVALARMAAARTVGGYVVGLNRAEVAEYVPATHGDTIHANHKAEITRLLLLLLPTSERFLAVLSYNSIMISRYGHCHQPNLARKLFSTTLRLSPAYALGDEDADVPERVFHDTFHNAGGNVLTAACRHPSYKAAMERLGFSNLSRRMPVKEPDTAIALNYSALYECAKSYVERGHGIPGGMLPPPGLAVHITALTVAANVAAVNAAAAVLRADSDFLRKSALFLAGFTLGALMLEHDDEDMTLRVAVRTYHITILGSFFIARESGSPSGMRAFNTGVAQGRTAPSAAAVAADAVAFLAEATAEVAQVV